MQLFPSRTLEELDTVDEGRLACALEARDVARQVQEIEGWSRGETTMEDFMSTDVGVRQEYANVVLN